MKKKSFIQLPEILAEGLSFEVSADLNLAGNPLVFVKTKTSDHLLSSSFVLSASGLELIGECFADASKEIEEKYDAYWKQQKAIT